MLVVHELLVHPPAAHFLRLCRVFDVHDAQDKTVVSLTVARDIDVASAIVEETVRSGSAFTLELGEKPGVFWIVLQVPNHYASPERKPRFCSVQLFHGSPMGGHHDAVTAYLDFRRALSVFHPVEPRTFYPLHVPGLGRIGYIHDVPTVVAE